MEIMIFKQDNPVSVTNTGIKGGPVIKIHIKNGNKNTKKKKKREGGRSLRIDNLKLKKAKIYTIMVKGKSLWKVLKIHWRIPLS